MQYLPFNVWYASIANLKRYIYPIVTSLSRRIYTYTADAYTHIQR